MWGEPTGWTGHYFELCTVCHSCGSAAVTYTAGFDSSSMHVCHNCSAEFTQEEGILRTAKKYVSDCLGEAKRGGKTESEMLQVFDKEIFGRAKFGSNATFQYTGYLDKYKFLTLSLPESFRHPPRASALVHPEGLDDTAGTFWIESLSATLTEVPVSVYGSTSKGSPVPFSLQVHGNIEKLSADMPPHFTFLDDAFRAVVRRDYDLAVFLGATAVEAFVGALLTNQLSSASNAKAIYKLVSNVGVKINVQDVLPLALGDKLPKDLSKSYQAQVGKVRNEFAHGKRPGTTLVDALHAIETCLSCMVWALRLSTKL